ncbi:MAG: phosphonate C-P lyase system protein PhnH [Methylovirgula sp.]
MSECGFAIPGLDAQSVFRTVLTALAEPGRIMPFESLCTPPVGVDPAAAAIVLALCDIDTPLWLSPSLGTAGDYFRFHAGTPIVAASSEALFLLSTADERPALDTLSAGTPDYPDRSATLIVSVDAIEDKGWQLSGPGIASIRTMLPRPIDAGFVSEWRANHARYPLGIDMIFTARDRVAGLPRSTRLEE